MKELISTKQIMLIELPFMLLVRKDTDHYEKIEVKYLLTSIQRDEKGTYMLSVELSFFPFL